jgi:PAS domain-containing protein
MFILSDIPLGWCVNNNNKKSKNLGDTKRLKAVINHVIDGIITITDKGIIDSFNQAATKMFGYSVDEVIGKNVKVLMPEHFHSGHDGSTPTLDLAVIDFTIDS